MNFISIQFFMFFCLIVGAMKLAKDKKQQHILLLIASYIFYAYGDLRFLILLITLSFLMWFLGIRIHNNRDNKKGKIYLIIGILIDILVLGVFKYYNFFVGSFGQLLGLHYTSLKLMLPLGISFYIFQSISYISDIYLKKGKAQASLLKVLLYIGFFPQIVSGPIVKARDFFPQLNHPISISTERLSWGVQKFTLGMLKKMVIANRLGVAVDAVFATPQAYSGLSLLVGLLSYSLQIYYDFSGYSDMAIGVAHVLGFDLGKNFNLPYLAKNPSDFWKRWHISLSSWFREYVYFPLGGSRKGRFLTYRNLFITMLLSGLWHGASWAFIFWGACHALASVFHKAFVDIRKGSGLKRTNNPIGNVVSVILNFSFVSLLWIPFRTNDFGNTLIILKRIFLWSSGVNYIYVYTLIFGAFLGIIEIIAVATNEGNDIWKPLDLSLFKSKVIFACFTFLILCFAYIANSVFIYSQF